MTREGSSRTPRHGCAFSATRQRAHRRGAGQPRRRRRLTGRGALTRGRTRISGRCPANASPRANSSLAAGSRSSTHSFEANSRFHRYITCSVSRRPRPPSAPRPVPCHSADGLRRRSDGRRAASSSCSPTSHWRSRRRRLSPRVRAWRRSTSRSTSSGPSPATAALSRREPRWCTEGAASPSGPPVALATGSTALFGP